MKAVDLIPKLVEQAREEYGMHSGERPREFLSDLVGARSVEELVDMFKAEEDNSDWDAARQKEPRDFDDILHSRMAVAFMASGRLGMHRRYMENELTAATLGTARTVSQVNMLQKARKAMTMKTHKE